MLCSKELLRKAVAEELWAPGLDEQIVQADLRQAVDQLSDNSVCHFIDKRGEVAPESVEEVSVP